MEKINLVELLKDCPRGMELDCTMFDDVTFVEIQKGSSPIIIRTPDRYEYLNSFGCYYDSCHSKCVIFPKGKTTWEGFVPPCKFKDGNVIIKKNFIAIISYIESSGRIWYHCWYNTKYKDCKIKTDFGIGRINDGDEIRFATEEEKQKLYDAIQDNGYKWNPETKTLEKLIKPVFKIGDKISLKGEDLYWDIKTIKGDWYICTNGAKIHIEEQHHYELVLVEPRFKVGDRIKCIYNNNQYDIKELTDTHYTLIEVKNKFKYTEPINEDKNWELVPNKFDINTLKTFDQVLVRLTNNCVWVPKFFYYYDTDSKGKYYPFVTIDNIGYPQCIPYNGNEHLSRTTNPCSDYYQIWNH